MGGVATQEAVWQAIHDHGPLDAAGIREHVPGDKNTIRKHVYRLKCFGLVTSNGLRRDSVYEATGDVYVTPKRLTPVTILKPPLPPFGTGGCLLAECWVRAAID